MKVTRVSVVLAMGLGIGCTSGAPTEGPSGGLFADAENHAGDSKYDTGWVSSLDATEVELDLEADVEHGTYWDPKAPLKVGQFALTYLRTHSDVFIQSLAEDYSDGGDSVEWLVDGTWVRGDDPTLRDKEPTHFRLRAISAVVLNPGDRDELATRTYDAVVPTRPSTLFTDAGESCGSPHGGIDVDQSVYWYLWNPDKSGCDQSLTQTVTLKVSRVLDNTDNLYPEYDRLTEDGVIDVIVFFGQVDHGSLTENDYAFSLIRDFESELESAGFERAEEAPLGHRYLRDQNDVKVAVDIYSPNEFAGLSDYAHVDNFDAAVRSHEIVVWNGHSVLGASDFWARPEIYEGDAATRYQIFLYNGCLGYEYYVSPILEGKQGWENVDLVTNTIETPFAIMVEESATALGLLIGGAERGGATTWNMVLAKMNDISGSSGFYGASGVRTNTFMP